MKTDTRQKQVLDQQLALSAYLDAVDQFSRLCRERSEGGAA